MVSYKALNTKIKSLIPNRCDTIWNVDGSEGTANKKSLIPNRCDTIGNDIDSFFCSIRNKSSFIFIK